MRPRIRVFQEPLNSQMTVVNAYPTRSPNGHRHYRKGVDEIVELKEGQKLPAWFTLDYDEAVELISALLDAGIKYSLPNDNSYISGKLEATEKHLDDMRRLVLLENDKGEV